jgi:hypothetical protein
MSLQKSTNPYQALSSGVSLLQGLAILAVLGAIVEIVLSRIA